MFVRTMFIGTMSFRAVSFWTVRLRVRYSVKLNERDLLLFVLCAVGRLQRQRRQFHGQLPERLLLRDGFVPWRFLRHGGLLCERRLLCQWTLWNVSPGSLPVGELLGELS
jgi:hypothetical protein